MRSSGLKLTIFLVILGTGIASTAWALGHNDQTIETAYVLPSSLAVPVPTSYVVSTGWVEPTAYAVPTYYTSAYWIDPVVLAQPTYAATVYERRGLFGRRWVERPALTSYYATTYVPSAYYVAPTVRASSYGTSSYVVTDPLVVPSSYVIPSAYVSPTECVCPSVVASAAPVARGSASTRTAPRSRSRSVQSQPEDLSAIDSSVPPAADEGAEPARGRGESGAKEIVPGTLPPDLPDTIPQDNTPTPPRPAAPSRSSAAPRTETRNTQPQTNANPAVGGASAPRVNTSPNLGAGAPTAGNTGATTPKVGTATPGAGAGNQNNPLPPPTAPGGVDANGLQDIGEPPPIRREVQRPAYYDRQPTRTRYPNILIGTVLTLDREPEEGVRISVRNADGAAKTTETNAFGRFAVRLADGDWSVEVTMPSGRVYEVSRLRVTDGVVTDRLGRRVPSLEITR